MPELPDIEAYRHALETRVAGSTLETVRLTSPFLLRTFDPKLDEAFGRRVDEVRRLGKRLVFALDGADEDRLFLVLHLMIAGRLAFKPSGAKASGRRGLAAFDFSSGTLILTEAGSKKRASLHVLRGESVLDKHDPGGLEVLDLGLDSGLDAFSKRLREENHTVKRALTDPRIFSGIGNAYSDEILHHARLSPFVWTRKMSDDDVARLFASVRAVLTTWRDRLIDEMGDDFPAKVTAFRPEMAVHGRFGKPCPDCDAPVQRIVYSGRETNYCARCQTNGRVLADRALSQLLKKDWPRTLEALEALRRPRQ